ncbi:MAG: MaoC family dehydratase [Solirubrobacteraceae bacterium]
MPSAEPIRVGGPHFEDFEVGQTFDAPGLTITAGHAALHQALVGDRMLLPLDATLSAAVTGRGETLAHPNLVCDVAIGQSTGPTQRVKGNLFYRGLVLLRPVFVGDTMRTTTEIVGLRQNRPRPDGSGTGLVALRIRTENQAGERVLDFWRCPMIPMRDGSVQTGHTDRFEDIPVELDMARVASAVPADWDYGAIRGRAGSGGFAALEVGQAYEIEGRDTVTAAPELVRLTLNVASTHVDAGAGAHGRRLVYGGHTISVAAAQMTRALPDVVTIVAWRECNHTAPVFEGDRLSTTLTIEGKHELEQTAGGGLVDLRALVQAERDGEESGQPVLDWRLLALMA